MKRNVEGGPLQSVERARDTRLFLWSDRSHEADGEMELVILHPSRPRHAAAHVEQRRSGAFVSFDRGEKARHDLHPSGSDVEALISLSTMLVRTLSTPGICVSFSKRNRSRCWLLSTTTLRR